MSNISVLIIDDETAVQKAVSAVLKREQMDVSCAGSGQLALDILKENTFDIILLDVIMPEQDGFDLLAELRRRRIYTPVILLSGKTEDAAQVEGLGLGADDYITKPSARLFLSPKSRQSCAAHANTSQLQRAYSRLYKRGLLPCI
mgnify:CR=1 FL=1